MRVLPLILAVVQVATIPCASLAAQDVQPSRAAAALGPLPGGIDDIPSTESPALPHKLLSALGSGAIGAGLGFFASQIASSDWQDVPGQTQLNRSLWAVVGGTVGFTLGFSFPVSFGRGAPPSIAPPRSSGRTAITRVEIQDATVSDAFEAVRIFRPHWLVERPSDTIRGTGTGTIRVYLDDFLLGGADQLREINAQTIGSIRFVDAPAATMRWGVGHNYGAIQVLTIG